MTHDKPGIGHIGLGLMGLHMPLRLLEAGYAVTVWNRTREKMTLAVARGARPGSSPADVARHSDVHLCLLDTEAVREVQDLNLLGQLADRSGSALPMTALATQLFRLQEAKGDGDLDITAVVKLFDAEP
ncbi:MAG: NAD(P)-binding domain-containing protein [Candidatus Rokuibacteriota bacterium]